MKAYSSSFLATLLVLVALDAGWLMLVAARLFQSQLGEILRPEPMLGAAITFYLVYAGGLVVLAVQPAIDSRSLSAAAAKGAVLGLTAYATFDLTNLAIITSWTIELAALDIAWGVVVSALASSAGFVAGSRALPSAAVGERAQ